ncbi:MAG: glycosyltransferase family 39 protein [Devosia sp.]|nr:glycosyltransferase family 39 protein [Devosia sp.]
MLSYLDHPPMVAWFVRLGTTLFGNTPFGARFAFIVALPLIELVFADIARRRAQSMTAALLVVLALEATAYFGGIAVIIEPGVPMVLFTALLFWSLCRLDETGDPRWWLAVGLFGGLALLSKYLVVFFAPAVLVYVLASPRGRRAVKSRYFGLAILVTLLLFLPVLIWNALHDWASFRFQFARASSNGPADLAGLRDYLATNLAFAGIVLAPVVALGSVLALIAGWRRGDAVTVSLAVAFLVPFLYLAERALHFPVYPSWAIVMWPFGITALAIAVGMKSGRRRRWLAGFAGAGIVLALPVVTALLVHGIVPGVWLGGRDPIGSEAGFGGLAQQALALAKAHGATWIATSDYRTYATLRWQLRDQMPVVMVIERSRFLDFAPPDLSSIDNQPGLYVFGGSAGLPLVEQAIAGHAQPVGRLDRIWRGVSMGSYGAELITGWKPPLDAPPGTPFYLWPTLA